MLNWINLKIYALIYCLLPVTGCFSEDNTEIIRKAEQLSAEGHFNDAIPLYQQMLYANAQPYQELVLHLTNCYLEISDPKAALDILSPLSLSSAWESDRIYLLSLAYYRLNAYQQSIQLLNSLGNNPRAHLTPEISFTKGLNLFQLKKLSEATLAFEQISFQPTAPQFYFLSQLYLTRIALINRQFSQATVILEKLELPLNHPLVFEKLYLQGLTCFLSGKPAEAISHFEWLLSQTSSASPWIVSTQRYLVNSYLQLAQKNREEYAHLFLPKAETLLKELHAHSTEDIDYLLLGDFYLIQARSFKEQVAYEKAQALFSNQTIFRSPTAKLTATLKFIDALPSYQERLKQYEQEFNAYALDNSARADLLYWKGLDAIKEALLVYQKNPASLQSKAYFEEAIQSLVKAYEIFSISNPTQARSALKLFMLANLFNPSNTHLEEHALFLQTWRQSEKEKLTTWREPEELDLLMGLIWKRLAEKNESAFTYAIESLKKAQEAPLSSPHASHAAKALGLLYMQYHRWEEAELVLNKLLVQHPDYCDAILLLALCAEKLKQTDRQQLFIQKISTQYLHSTAAPIAYFYTYNYREYLKGDKKALKHLQSMPSRFPHHPLTITAYYLLGLDHLKDRLTNEGAIIRKKDLVAAIDAFEKAESTYETLIEKQKIPVAVMPYYMQVCYRSMLERALANLAVAHNSQGTKSKIYLEYAEEVFQQLIDDLQKVTLSVQTQSPVAEELVSLNSTYVHFLQESYFWLAKTQLKKNQFQAAAQTFEVALQLYQQLDQKHGYLLSRIWYEKGKIAQVSQEYIFAIECFEKAQQAASQKPCLSPDQKVELWIEQSLSYKALNDLENAMLLLSKAVNDEAISSLRVKAMYLRVELYELQGRPELALKQLEAVAKKGGEWGQLAKNKLKENYGY